jgi:AbrB family looped-hinge helix DNA binding protein
MTKTAIYKQEDIFQEIPGDDKNVLMNIPPEVCEKMGWKPGDRIKVEVNEDRTISIKKVKDE